MDRYAQWAGRLDHRLGIGEFVDAQGFMPRLIGRIQYLLAMAIECQTPLDELIDVWSPCIEVMLELDREMKARLDPQSAQFVLAADLQGVEALLEPIELILGIRLSVLLRALGTGSADRSLPADSPAMSAATAALRTAFDNHAEWMKRWRLPTDEVGWCFVTAGFGALSSLESADRSGYRTRASGTTVGQAPHSVVPDHALPDLALFDRDRMNDALSAMFGAIEDPSAEGLPQAIGRWVADLIATTRGAAEVVTVPPLSWNPLVETRGKARRRLCAEADRAITDQLDATIDRLTAAGNKQPPSKSSGLVQFQWLVRNQIKGQTEEAIANADCRSVGTVHKALLETRRLVGLRRPRGRPRSSRPATA